MHRRSQASSAPAPPHRPLPATPVVMPPRIPVRAAWTRSPATTTTSNRRALSSTPPRRALGPQSPNYIHVPRPLQPTFPLERPAKGHLPVPRDVFKTRSSLPKQSPGFLASSTPPPTARKVPGPHSRDVDARLYKQRLADRRRAALHDGVRELHARKVASEAQYLAKIQASGAFRRALALAPPRPVDVLTQTSTAKGVRDFLADDLAPRPDTTAARRTAFARRTARVQAVRTSRLHDLYTNARTFIIDEQQLDDAIEAAFGTDDAPMGWDNKGHMGPRQQGNEGLSPWHGPMPEGVGDMLQKLKGGEGVGLAKERVRRLAEELTGGKM